jgi:hypothetical protein
MVGELSWFVSLVAAERSIEVGKGVVKDRGRRGGEFDIVDVVVIVFSVAAGVIIEVGLKEAEAGIRSSGSKNTPGWFLPSPRDIIPAGLPWLRSILGEGLNSIPPSPNDLLLDRLCCGIGGVASDTDGFGCESDDIANMEVRDDGEGEGGEEETEGKASDWFDPGLVTFILLPIGLLPTPIPAPMPPTVLLPRPSYWSGGNTVEVVLKLKSSGELESTKWSGEEWFGDEDDGVWWTKSNVFRVSPSSDWCNRPCDLTPDNKAARELGGELYWKEADVGELRWWCDAREEWNEGDKEDEGRSEEERRRGIEIAIGEVVVVVAVVADGMTPWWVGIVCDGSDRVALAWMKGAMVIGEECWFRIRWLLKFDVAPGFLLVLSGISKRWLVNDTSWWRGIVGDPDETEVDLARPLILVGGVGCMRGGGWVSGSKVRGVTVEDWGIGSDKAVDEWWWVSCERI